MRYTFNLILILLLGCSTSPGRLKKLDKQGIPYQNECVSISLPGATTNKISIQYLGCGGLYILKDGNGIMIDPFFSNQKIIRLASSVLGKGEYGKKKLFSDPKMISFGLNSIERASGNPKPQVKAVLVAHSHYDHLMDVPAVFDKLGREALVYVNQSGFNVCRQVIDTSKMAVIEQHMTTSEVTRPPIEVATTNGKINIYPILSEHNPHLKKNIKFFSGHKTTSVDYFKNPYDKTRANDWLEGNTFSFLIDYVDASGVIEFRIFVQSSSCNPLAGIPPLKLLKDKNVDVAFLGVASYQFSPDYPCALLQAIRPKEVVWIHWEDFFRKYTKKPKTVRATDVAGFFNKPCVNAYKANALMPWPGVPIEITY